MTTPDFATRFGPVPETLRLLFYERARGTGTYALNLAVNATMSPEIALFTASRNRDGSVRATILKLDTDHKQFQLLGMDGDKMGAAIWFRCNGVPVLSIGHLLT